MYNKNTVVLPYPQGIHSKVPRGWLKPWMVPNPIYQRSPTFLAPGTGFVEDNFSTDQGGRIDDSSAFTFKLISCCAAQFLIGLDWYCSEA